LRFAYSSAVQGDSDFAGPITVAKLAGLRGAASALGTGIKRYTCNWQFGLCLLSLSEPSHDQAAASLVRRQCLLQLLEQPLVRSIVAKPLLAFADEGLVLRHTRVIDIVLPTQGNGGFQRAMAGRALVITITANHFQMSKLFVARASHTLFTPLVFARPGKFDTADTRRGGPYLHRLWRRSKRRCERPRGDKVATCGQIRQSNQCSRAVS